MTYSGIEQHTNSVMEELYSRVVTNLNEQLGDEAGLLRAVGDLASELRVHLLGQPHTDKVIEKQAREVTWRPITEIYVNCLLKKIAGEDKISYEARKKAAESRQYLNPIQSFSRADLQALCDSENYATKAGVEEHERQSVCNVVIDTLLEYFTEKPAGLSFEKGIYFFRAKDGSLTRTLLTD